MTELAQVFSQIDDRLELLGWLFDIAGSTVEAEPESVNSLRNIGEAMRQSSLDVNAAWIGLAILLILLIIPLAFNWREVRQNRTGKRVEDPEKLFADLLGISESTVRRDLDVGWAPGQSLQHAVDGQARVGPHVSPFTSH